jgi:protein involved in polysaccharide export with SLBB domain
MQSSSLFAWIALVLCLLAVGMEQRADRRLAPGDELHITVADRPEFSTDAKVASDGSIDIPHIGRVRLAGLSKMLAESYLAERVLASGVAEAGPVDIEIVQSRHVKLAEAAR